MSNYGSMSNINETDLATPLRSDGIPQKSMTQQKKRLLMTDCLIIAGCAFMALLSATPNGFNTISKLVQDDTGITDTELALFSGLSVGLLQFSLPWGALRDHFGPVITAICSAICVIGGYVLFSFTSDKTFYLMMISGILVGLGSSGTFLSALATSLDLGYPFGVGLVSLAMSLSIALTSYMGKIYEKAAHCTANHCWRPMVRMWCIVCACAFVTGIAALTLLPRRSRIVRSIIDLEEDGAAVITEPTKAENGDNVTGAKSLVETLAILKDPLFLAMFTINTFSVAAGVFVVTETAQVWEDFNTVPSRSGWNVPIQTSFSVCTAFANVVAPVFTDYVHRRGIFSKYKIMSLVLLVIGTDMLLFGMVISIGSIDHSRMGVSIAAAGMIAAVGLCFGTFLVMTPVAVAELFGMENFGIFVSYSQIGSAVFASVTPLIATAVKSKAGSFSPMFFGLGGCLVLASTLMYWVAKTLQRRNGAKVLRESP